MILNLLTTIAAASIINPNIGINVADFNQQYISDVCQITAVEHGIENPEEDQYTIKDLDGNVFVIQTGEEAGFMVYDPIADAFIEKSSTLECPYVFEATYDNYYLGPMKYYSRVEDTFYSLGLQGDDLNLLQATEMQEIFRDQLADFREMTSEENYQVYIAEQNASGRPIRGKIKIGNKTYIDNYEYIRDTNHPSNYDGSCGFVAASIVLNYWDKTVHSGTVLPQYLDSNGELNDTGSTYSPSTNLKDKLVQYNGGKRGSTAVSVSKAMNSYCKDNGIKGSADWYIGKIGLESSLRLERPAIVFGWLSDPRGGWNMNHAVTVYGTESTWWGGYYIANYGWGSSWAEVSMGFGFAGTTATFSLDKNHYSANYTVSPNEYGFHSAYSTSRVTQTVAKGEFSFETSRLRTGYIENEYINLSPRRSGYDTAYLEYKFTNPVRRLDLDLSFWSNDERYGTPNIAQAVIEYKDQNGNTWKHLEDLLNSGLPTNRNNQKTYSFSFSRGTKDVRIYTHFDYMSGQTDRNKGRISIGDITVYTYK